MQETIEERLLRLKKKIDNAKTEKATLEGKLTAQHERLKELGCSTVKEAQKKSDELRKEAGALQAEVEKKIKEFEAEYGF